MLSHILAIDGGGTKTTVLLADQNGKILGQGSAGPMSLAATTADDARQNMMKAVILAVGSKEVTLLTNVVVGLAGVDTEQEKKLAKEIFATELKKQFQCKNFELLNDTIIALESGTSSQNAIVLIAGTGSNCFGRNDKGEQAKAGGMDYLLSDQGSGFDIGQQVLRSAVKSFDGRGQKTMLETLICEHFSIENAQGLKNVVYHPPLNKTEIAKLAKLCFVAFDAGDAKANQILSQALDELMNMIEAVIKRLKLTEKSFDLVLVGGIATDPYFHRMIELTMNVRYPRAKVILPEKEPVYGALKIAVKE